MKIRFLLDENLNPRIKLALVHHDPTIDVLRVGELGAPPLGTLDLTSYAIRRRVSACL